MELDKESAEDVRDDNDDKDDDHDGDKPAKKKQKPVKHLGPGFSKHSKTAAEVEAEHTTPLKRVRQKTIPTKIKMPKGYVSSDLFD